MSTTIYTGFRCRVQHANKAIDYLRITMWRKVVKLAKEDKLDYHNTAAVEDFVKEYSECGFHLWFDTQMKYAYFTLWGTPYFSEIRRTPAWLESFYYWNNTDKPKHISNKTWRYRRKVWNEVALDDKRWDRRLTNVVFPKGSFGLFKLLEELDPKVRKNWQIKKKDLLGQQTLPK